MGRSLKRRARDEVVGALQRVLGPFIGAAMVRASANGHWDRLGLGAYADEEQWKSLLSALGPGLNVFVGRRRGESLMAEVETALLGSGGAP